ncbi:MAG: ABC transporter permease subunit [Myxococcota bacterium]
MLGSALRRLLWVLPSAFGVSLLTFYALTLVPPSARLSAQERRDRFFDLPRFFNARPHDVRSRTGEAVTQIVDAAARGERDRRAGAVLRRLGGAALPSLLPGLDTLAPEAREAVVRELAPVARRMSLDGRLPDDVGPTSVVFWNRLWETREADFDPGTARSAVRRYADYGTAARAQPLRELDTYALPYLFEVLDIPERADEVVRAQRLLDVVEHVTEGDGTPPVAARRDDAGVEATAAAVRAWRRWWLVHETDYQTLVGARRVVASLTQTQYGKWVYETVALDGRQPASQTPAWQELARRGRVTLTLLGGGLLGAYAGAFVLAAFAVVGSRRRRWRGRLVTVGTVVPYIVSPVVLGVIAARWLGPSGAATWGGAYPWATLILAWSLLAEPTRHLRDALVPFLATESAWGGLARGVSSWRLVLVHGARGAGGLVAARLATELPVAVTLVFVLERAFDLPGLGVGTLTAVAERDVGWLMAIALGGTAATVLLGVFGDLTHASLDPRLREALPGGRRRRVG